MLASIENIFFDRDLSWLSFNSRVLEEAGRRAVPLKERLNFLSIYSSNLDEFYRVRMPALLALNNVTEEQSLSVTLGQIQATIQKQQERFGEIFTREVISDLADNHIVLLFNQTIPKQLHQEVSNYFFEVVAGFIQLVELNNQTDFFPENNQLYLAVTVEDNNGNPRYYVLKVPSDKISRFYSIRSEQSIYILFIEDVIKHNLDRLFGQVNCLGCYSFKVTRDAELDLKDEFEGNLAQKIEHEILHRDHGLASRFLYDAQMPETTVKIFQRYLRLKETTLVKGSTYHNLKDLASLPLHGASFSYSSLPVNKFSWQPQEKRLFDHLLEQDVLLHPPYHNYDTVLRFFNEAATDIYVTRIYVTLYRVATESRIANALISAAKNGKKVTVFVELKARFDESNNIKWAKRMKQAGVKVLFSIPTLKVHAKVALVKRKVEKKSTYFGIFSTGNFNESTARFYTDHVLLTSNMEMLKEAETLFKFLKNEIKPSSANEINFRHLLVAQFNLKDRFVELIDREIMLAKSGADARIDIKVNNLEERTLIEKLYQASQAGVKVNLIVRSICCLIPGIQGVSENISVIRIVDRYLEHGRIFIFYNNGNPDVYLGSADWMNRNIYRRIEVCFPIKDVIMKQQLIEMMNIQLSDNTQAVRVNGSLENEMIVKLDNQDSVQSQLEISSMINKVE